MPELPNDALPVPAPGVMFQALDDGAVLFSADAEVYFGLNHAGAAVWELLPPATASLAEMCGILAERFPDATVETITADVVALLDELTREGLLVPADGTPAAPPGEAG